MNVTWALLTALSLACHAASRCSPTSYYKNCWIRRFPGIFIDVEESQRRGAQLLQDYREESALKCSRTCCLARNFSCNLAVFHYDATQENVNCFHLRCPTLESCVPSPRSNVVLYNISKGVDPDLLVFGKSFASNVRVLPHHYGRVNASEPLPSDKRQFIHPPPPAVPPLTSAPAVKAPITLSTVTGSRARTAAPTPAVASLPPSSNTALSSAAATTLSRYDAQTATAFSSTAARPSTSVPARYPAVTLSQPASGPPASTAAAGDTESSKQNPNVTKDEDEGVGEGDTSGELGPGWHVAAHSLVVALAICVTVLLSCCCSILLFVSWRGQRKRMGRYRTSWRGKKGSMRLIKYVLVRESS